MKCKICNQEVKNLLALSTHIQFKHENKKKEYYDLYMGGKDEGFCKTCKNPTNFRIFSTGYEIYCCEECERIDYSERMSLDNPMKYQISKDNQRKTNQKRYGVDQNTQREEIKEKIKRTNNDLYGVDNVSQVQEFQDQAKKNREKTCMREHGVSHYFMLEEVKAKMRKTFFKKYGYENCMQNEDVFLRNQKSGCQAKAYENLYYRGSFELDFLEKYYRKLNIQQGISFDYIFDEKNKKYHSDFYLPEFNLIVEIKNSYASKKYKEIIDAKKEAVLAAGYNFIMIINKDYSDFDTLLSLSIGKE